MPRVFKPRIEAGACKRNQKIDEASKSPAKLPVASSSGPKSPKGGDATNQPTANCTKNGTSDAIAASKNLGTPIVINSDKDYSSSNTSCIEPSPLINVDIDAELPESSLLKEDNTTPIKLFEVKQKPRKHHVYGEAPPPTDKPLDRSTVTLRSLLNWVPTHKPPPRIRDIELNSTSSKGETPQLSSSSSKTVNKKCEDTTSALEEPHIDPFAPQLRLDADGNIVLDEQSLNVSHPEIIDTGNLKHVAEEASIYGTTYNSFRRRPIHHRGRKWTEKDTTRFYRALSTIGTDFYCMTKLFPNRTRNQLLKKFKREERLFPHLVDEALKNKRDYDITVFYNSGSDSEDKYEKLTKDAIAEKRKAPRNKSDKRTPKKRSTCDISALIDEVLARDTIDTEKDEYDIEKRCKLRKTDSVTSSAAAPCSLAQMIEKTAAESNRENETENPLSSSISP